MRRLPLHPLVPIAVAAFVLAGCSAPEPGATDAPLVVATDAATATADPAATEAPSDEPTGESSDGSSSSGSGSSGSSSGSAGSSSGSSSGSSGSSGASGSGSSSSSAPEPAAPSATISVVKQQCSGQNLTLTVTARYDNSYRKGITKVVYERANEYGNYIDDDATWLGPETGAGDQWTGNPPGSKTQRFGDDLRITARFSGGETTITVPITVNC